MRSGVPGNRRLEESQSVFAGRRLKFGVPPKIGFRLVRNIWTVCIRGKQDSQMWNRLLIQIFVHQNDPHFHIRDLHLRTQGRAKHQEGNHDEK